MAIRQPIITVVGHIDHGKTTLLDNIRKTCLAKREAGGITQAISFTVFPSSILEERCNTLLKKYKIKLEIPGFLFIDTPGHAAFRNLRARGGALADIAILVIDINEGIMPQTEECLAILEKTPFLVALNKIDAISGWRHVSDDLEENIKKQADFVKKAFEEKLYKIIVALSRYGFDADIFYSISDFSKQLCLVPCSGKIGEGISELLVMLAGLSQKFLLKKLEVKEESRGVVLEVKREKDFIYLDSVLYSGVLAQNDRIFFAGLEKPISTKVRVLLEALPLSKGFKQTKKVKAATGIRIACEEAEKVMSGMPFIARMQEEQATEELKKEISENIKLDNGGIMIKADSLGSLEALLFLLKKKGIKVGSAGIGNISKADVVSAFSYLESKPLNAIVLGFNVGIAEEATKVKEAKDVRLIVNEVIYKLIEDFGEWQEQRKKEIEREKLLSIIMPCKIQVLHYVFRKSKPAIFGVKVLTGILKQGMPFMNAQGENIEKIKSIQSQNKRAEQAASGEEVAIAMQITFGRQVKEKEILYSEVPEEHFLKLKENKNLLNSDEIKVMREIAEIKRKTRATWGI